MSAYLCCLDTDELCMVLIHGLLIWVWKKNWDCANSQVSRAETLLQSNLHMTFDPWWSENPNKSIFCIKPTYNHVKLQVFLNTNSIAIKSHCIVKAIVRTYLVKKPMAHQVRKPIVSNACNPDCKGMYFKSKKKLSLHLSATG